MEPGPDDVTTVTGWLHYWEHFIMWGVGVAAGVSAMVFRRARAEGAEAAKASVHAAAVENLAARVQAIESGHRACMPAVAAADALRARVEALESRERLAGEKVAALAATMAAVQTAVERIEGRIDDGFASVGAALAQIAAGRAHA
ncbi:hypothetical protein DFR50_14233 [Roseiarcus fermentans]|uniref:Uncharacterized protein n=1 Tax=Roseiarcus fermentans TaxID=1473586 RepID=A0A366EQM6_9HYPH|nr:hypothetical protein [Roseiarcus fermentans]RBP03785.1 hypothetical protein DFR50_14233 [Roseiarcus fermentans]